MDESGNMVDESGNMYPGIAVQDGGPRLWIQRLLRPQITVEEPGKKEMIIV